MALWGNMSPFGLMRSGWMGAMAIAACAVLAQTPPDAGRIFQDTRSPPQRTIAPPPIHLPAPLAASPSAGGDAQVLVTQFDFTGNSALPADLLRATLAPWVGKLLNFGDLVQAVEAVEARYKEAGYFLAQAYLPPQKIRNGSIEIAISEGRLGEARLEGESRVGADVVYAYLDRLPRGKALTLDALERQALLINDLAGARVSLDLQAGDVADTTDVVLVQQAENLWSGRVEANNHGLPSTGERRLGLTLNANSPFQMGERLSLNALTSEGRGLGSYNLRGEFPLGTQGWRIFAGASRADYSLGGDFSQLQASGTVDSVRMGATYPLVRSRNRTVRVQLEVDRNTLSDNMQSVNSHVDKQSGGLSITLSADGLDDWAGGGGNHVDLTLRSGQLDLDAATALLDASAAGTAGAFKKATLALQRQQTLTRETSMQLELRWQVADKNLDSSEKLSLGGPTSIPGYVSGDASGDSGMHARLGLRWQPQPQWALGLFTDYAQLQLAHDPAVGVAGNDRQLRDFGVSADWQWSSHVLVNAVAAWAQTDARRFWFNVGYLW